MCGFNLHANINEMSKINDNGNNNETILMCSIDLLKEKVDEIYKKNKHK